MPDAASNLPTPEPAAALVPKAEDEAEPKVETKVEPIEAAPLTEAAEAEIKAFCPESTLNIEARALYLRSCSMSPFTVDAVAKLPWMGSLNSLTLSQTNLEADGLKRLLMHPSLAQLQALALLNQGFDDSKAEVIAARLAQGGLKSLSLQGSAVDERSMLSAQALSPLLSPAKPMQLEVLKIELFGLEDAAAATALAAMSIRVEALTLNTMGLTDAHIKALISQGRLDGVKRLALAGNALADEAAKALASRPALRDGLEALDLTGNEVADAGLEALLALPALKQLNLYNNKVTGAALNGLKADGALKNLDLGMCPLNDKALSKIAQIKGVEINTME